MLRNRVETIHRANHGVGLLIVEDDDYEVSASAERFKVLVDRLRERYDMILVDAGILTTVRCAGWQRVADRVLLLVDSASTNIETLSRLKQEMPGRNLRIDGIVLNKRQFHIPNFIYRKLF